jgi:hypothetical protein
MNRIFALALTLAALVPPPIAAGQVVGVPDTLAATELPVSDAEEIARHLNDPTLDRRDGDVTIAADERLEGDLAVLEGTLTIAGAIVGDVLVVNGNVAFETGGSVTGDVLIVGGEAVDLDLGRVDGQIVTYPEEFAYERVAGRIRYLRGPRPLRTGNERDGYADFLIATGKSYNRVEGMPISFGPRLETSGSNPLRLQALAIYRSESGFSIDPDEMGYFVRAEQFFAGHREFRVGLTLHSLIDPIEDWQLTDLESGLATFLLHRDYRDHYQRRGWSATASWEPNGSLHLVQLEWRSDTHESRASGSPWSLFRNADNWRPQPVVAEGRLRSAILRAQFDTRTSTVNPASGLLIRGHLEQVVSGTLAYPDVVDASSMQAISGGDEHDYGRFMSGLVDMRSYNRVNADSRLNFRIVAGGTLDRGPLPPQRQHALGGEGALPGYPLFSADCGARSRRVRLIDGQGTARSDDLHPHYGCDAFAMLQAEFRGKLSFRFRWDAGPWREGGEEPERVWDFGWDMRPDWALFVDAGRGWTFSDRPDENLLVNAGAGLLLDRIGVYLAVPLEGGSGVNLFVRLGPRF